MKNKKVTIAIISVIALVLVIIGITYAYWLVTETQTDRNVITTGCLDITLNGEANDITLENQFPMTDEDGLKLTPYEFTVTNNCNTAVDYQINLESLGEENESISSSAIKIALDDDVLSLLSERNIATPTLEETYDSRVIKMSRLSSVGSEGSSISHKLKMWIDSNAPISEMNKSFRSKITVSVGQNIINPFEESSLAYDIVSAYGGPTAVTSLSAIWESNGLRNQTYLSGSSSSSYYFGTSYEYDSKTKTYKLSGDVIQATIAECRAGKKSDGTTISCGKYTFLRTSNTSTYPSIYKITSFYNVNKKDSSSTLYMDGVLLYPQNDFNNMELASTSNLYKTQDDLGDSYYFRGNVTTNYVKFGEYLEDYKMFRGYMTETSTVYREYISLEECTNAESYNYKCSEYIYAKAGDPMYWRIVRINGDGTIRLIYDGTTLNENNVTYLPSISYTNFYTYPGSGKFYFGDYIYDVNGTNTNSLIKNIIDNWYEENLDNKYSQYISDNIFCNDTSQKADNRILKDLAPSLICLNEGDKYSKNTDIGNGLLTYPVGLITVDEIMLAGSFYYTLKSPSGGESYLKNTDYYLANENSFWTMTYSGYNSSYDFMFVTGSSKLYTRAASAQSSHVRPVINLKADVKFTGDGSYETPYEIVTE